jgi:predicted nucleic acid-binding protein
MDLELLENKTARQFESGIETSEKVVDEIASRLQALRMEQRINFHELKKILKLTNKRNYADFLSNKITFKQFKKRVYIHCAE